MCVTLNYALLFFTWFFKIYIMYFLLNYVLPFFASFCKFRSHASLLIMPFLFSFEFPTVQRVPLNYAVVFLAWFFKPELCVCIWIIPFFFFTWFFFNFMFSIELCPPLFNKSGPLHSLRQSTQLQRRSSAGPELRSQSFRFQFVLHSTGILPSAYWTL